MPRVGDNGGISSPNPSTPPPSVIQRYVEGHGVPDIGVPHTPPPHEWLVGRSDHIIYTQRNTKIIIQREL